MNFSTMPMTREIAHRNFHCIQLDTGRKGSIWIDLEPDFVETAEIGSSTQAFETPRGKYVRSASSTNFAENPATQGTQRCSGRFLFLANEESLKPLVAAGAPKNVVCMGLNPIKVYPSFAVKYAWVYSSRLKQ